MLTAVTFLGITVTVTAVNFFVNAEGYGQNHIFLFVVFSFVWFMS